MAASETEFPLFRKLPTANQSTTNCTARLEPSIQGGVIVRHEGVIDHSTGCKSDATV